MSQRDCQIIAFGNQKGGVCKTTNSVNVAAGLGQLGFKVLLIDADPQASATEHLGVDPDSSAGTYELLVKPGDSNEYTVENLRITEKMPKGVHLIPSRTYLAELSQAISEFANKPTLFRKEIEPVMDEYDFVIIDTPPQPGAITTIAAYGGADWLVLSVQPEPLAVNGMLKALSMIGEVREMCNPNLKILGILVSRADSRSTAWKREIVDPLNSKGYGHFVFASMIRLAQAVSKCQKKGVSLFQDRKLAKEPVLDDYRHLCAEIINRIDHVEEFLAGKLEAKASQSFETQSETAQPEAEVAAEGDETETAPEAPAPTGPQIVETPQTQSAKVSA